MINSIHTPFPQCISLLRQNIALDPHFQTFYTWARAAHVPVIVLSSGMTPIIRALLVQLLGPDAEDIEIVCNEVVDRPPRTKEMEGGWNIQFHDDSQYLYRYPMMGMWAPARCLGGVLRKRDAG